MNNRLYNCANPHQGKYKKVLCVCSAGLLRSPTIAEVLSQPPYNFNTRAVGFDLGHALIPLDSVLLKWADEVVVVDEYMRSQLTPLVSTGTKIINLNIGDNYAFRDKELIQKIKERYNARRSEWLRKEVKRLQESRKDKEKKGSPS